MIIIIIIIITIIIIIMMMMTMLVMMMVMVRFTNRTFTASQDCLTIPIRVYPVIPVNHLISFTGLDLTARFSRKLLNGAKGDCVIEKETL